MSYSITAKASNLLIFICFFLFSQLALADDASLPTFAHHVYADDALLIIGTYDAKQRGKLYVSIDGGETWTKQSIGDNTGAGYISQIKKIVPDGDNFYVLTEFYSSDHTEREDNIHYGKKVGDNEWDWGVSPAYLTIDFILDMVVVDGNLVITEGEAPNKGDHLLVSKDKGETFDAKMDVSGVRKLFTKNNHVYVSVNNAVYMADTDDWMFKRVYEVEDKKVVLNDIFVQKDNTLYAAGKIAVPTPHSAHCYDHFLYSDDDSAVELTQLRCYNREDAHHEAMAASKNHILYAYKDKGKVFHTTGDFLHDDPIYTEAIEDRMNIHQIFSDVSNDNIAYVVDMSEGLFRCNLVGLRGCERIINTSLN